jgi:hypothetical protein
MPSSNNDIFQSSNNIPSPNIDESLFPPESLNINSDHHAGTLDPLAIEHTASSFASQLKTVRNDLDTSPEYEVYFPCGVIGNAYSGFCDGGYFQVGPGGFADFGSPAGTLSWWGKWNGTATNGRYWGQETNFETRWSAGRLVLDFGSDITLVGDKSDWVTDKWYFFAITWDEIDDFLGIYWGDENTTPVEDVATSTWTGSVVGLHLENRIMNSRQMTAPVNGNIDDFRYYTTRRSLEEIQSDYNTVLSGDELGLSNYFRFENDLSDSAGSEDLVSVGSYFISRDIYRDIDGWSGTQIDLSISEIRTLYALNGTFDNGVPGINQDWSGDGIYHPNGWLARREVLDFRGRQRASYVEDVDDYIVIENEGYFFSSPDRYQHYNGTKIYWYQTVDNTALNEEFLFDMNYLYQRGPIGTKFEGNFTLSFEILDGSEQLWNWSIDLVNVTQRQQWYSAGPTLVNITSAPSSFDVRVNMDVSASGSYVEILDNDPDIDGDAANAQFLTVYIDDISLTSVNFTDPAEVNMSVYTAEVGSNSIYGQAGFGSILLNHSYWESFATPIQFSANANVSFKCTAKFSQMYRNYNSSATTSIDDQGVSYSCSSGQNLNLTCFTYIPSYPEAVHLGIRVHHPVDWENTTIFDPFNENVTSSMVSTESGDELPIGSVDSVGWWQIKHHSPNYADNIVTESYDTYTSWMSENIFLDGDTIRCNITLGTEENTPTSSGALEITWMQPSQEIWYIEYNANFTGYNHVSTPLTFGQLNATQGSWSVEILWQNGTEIAYDVVEFELHHILGLIAYTPSIDTQVNDSFIITVYLYDQDTSATILSGDADVKGNWSGSDHELSPNLAKSWWEVELNASSLATGTYSITINASMPYYQNATCAIEVHVRTLAIMTIYNGQQITISPGDNHTAKVRYMYVDGSGIDNANVSVLTWSGPEGGLQIGSTLPVAFESGNYTLSFKATISGTYYITIVSTKEEHTAAATSIYLIVEPARTVVDVDDSELPDTFYYNQTYTLYLYYHTLDDLGIENANFRKS